ncbi:hypothetical protein OAH18_02840, partial [bacterium]|nr:hypothetical protein [bacterium]
KFAIFKHPFGQVNIRSLNRHDSLIRLNKCDFGKSTNLSVKRPGHVRQKLRQRLLTGGPVNCVGQQLSYPVPA